MADPQTTDNAREIAAQLIPHTTSVHNVQIIQRLLDMALPELPRLFLHMEMVDWSDETRKLFHVWLYSAAANVEEVYGEGSTPREAVLAAMAKIQEGV